MISMYSYSQLFKYSVLNLNLYESDMQTVQGNYTIYTNNADLLVYWYAFYLVRLGGRSSVIHPWY